MLSHELLHENGSLYVHLDWHVGHYAKCVLDEVFGKENFINEIVRVKCNPKNYTSSGFGNIHDVIYSYAKSDEYTWNKILGPVLPQDLEEGFPLIEPKTNRRYTTVPLHAPAIRYGITGKPWKGIPPPKGRHWAFVPESLDKFEREGRIAWSETGNPRLKMYADECPGYPIQDIWSDFKDTRQDIYATQKPEALLERIIKASSNSGDLVLDILVAAARRRRLRRSWGDVGSPATWAGLRFIRRGSGCWRFPDVRPFVVQNLGKYERQLWAGAEFGEGNGKQAAARQRAYVEFILKLYNAKPIHGYTWLHGLHGGRMVHVGAVDSPVSDGDVRQMAVEFKKAIGKGADAPKTNGIDVLGWDFAFELNEVSKQQAAAANIQLRFIKIPRDVMDKRAVEQGEVKFFELAALAVEAK